MAHERSIAMRLRNLIANPREARGDPRSGLAANRRPARTTVRGIAAAVVLVFAAVGTTSAARPVKPVVLFSQSTPGTYAWQVPSGVKRARFELQGAAGGQGGGRGGKVTATFAVVPGERFEIVVGGKGGDVTTAGSNGGGAGASSGNDLGGGGGGGTDVRAGACTSALTCNLADRVLVAGGGGGGAYDSLFATAFGGGSGGGLVGGTGAGDGGTGGAPSTGGTAPGGSAHGGTFGAGGEGGGNGWFGGGGGGGWFGGGGGGGSTIPPSRGGGGGGSAYVSGLAISSSVESGVRVGDGVAVITKA